MIECEDTEYDEHGYEICHCHICTDTRSCLICKNRCLRNETAKKLAQKQSIDTSILKVFDHLEKNKDKFKYYDFINSFTFLLREFYQSEYIKDLHEIEKELEEKEWIEILKNREKNKDSLCQMCILKKYREINDPEYISDLDTDIQDKKKINFIV